MIEGELRIFEVLGLGVSIFLWDEDDRVFPLLGSFREIAWYVKILPGRNFI